MPPRRARHSLLGARQAAGLVLALALLAAGRVVRQRLLVGPDGAWRDELWLDAMLEPAPAPAGTATPGSAGDAMGPPPGAAAPQGAAAGGPTGSPEGSREALPSPAAARRPAARKGAGPDAPLDPNTAPGDSLQLLPGVGPVLAGRIVAARQGGMIFRRPEDLLAVKGIGPAAMARLAPHLRFAGRAPAAPKPDNPH